MFDELGLGGRPRREVEQQGLVGERATAGHLLAPVGDGVVEESHPSALPTHSRTSSPVSGPSFEVSSAPAMTAPGGPPRSSSVCEVGRRDRSVVAGIITAPIRMQASIETQSGTTLPRSSSTRSPR